MPSGPGRPPTPERAGNCERDVKGFVRLKWAKKKGSPTWSRSVPVTAGTSAALSDRPTGGAAELAAGARVLVGAEGVSEGSREDALKGWTSEVERPQMHLGNLQAWAPFLTFENHGDLIRGGVECGSCPLALLTLHVTALRCMG